MIVNWKYGYERSPETIDRLAEEMLRGYERECKIGSAAYWAEQYEQYKRSTMGTGEDAHE